MQTRHMHDSQQPFLLTHICFNAPFQERKWDVEARGRNFWFWVRDETETIVGITSSLTKLHPSRKAASPLWTAVLSFGIKIPLPRN